MTSPFDSITIGSLTLKNRLAMAPIKTAFGTTDGRATEQLIGYLRRRAEGGVGLIIPEPFYVSKRGQEHPKQLGLESVDKLESAHRLASAVQKAGARVFAHLNHAGRAANQKAAGGPPEAPSVVVCPRTGVEPVALTPERITELAWDFVRAAERAKEAGFDGVELQFGLGYLVSQFLSPFTNQRTDQYGGDAKGRTRFAHQILTAVRATVGDAFPIAVRISASEKTPGGLEIDDAIGLARDLEAWGANLIHVVTGSNCESPPWYFQHMALPAGVNEHLAAQIRSEVTVPVMVAGRLGDPPRIRAVLEAGLVDMVAIGRGLLADPDLPNKMLAGKDDEVLLCGHCLQGCLANVSAGKGIGCNINPEVGHELEQVEPAGHPKRVVVIGGGPAGLQAAVTAKRRGHAVTLFEKTDHLGGQFRLAPLSPGKQRMREPLDSFVRQAQRAGVELRLGEEASEKALRALEPDVVLVATGSEPIIPVIPGVYDPMTGQEVIANKRVPGDDVLILGGGMVGMEAAELLGGQGKRCVVVEALDAVASGMDPISRRLLVSRLQSLPVEVLTRTELVRVEDGRAYAVHDGSERDLGRFDDVVVAVGNRAFDPWSETLREHGIQVRVIGDAEEPGLIYDAVNAAHRAAMAI